ncbi:MAG: ABC transporter substrate-binding protein [Rhodospirillaceae bacterium]|nr:ABC transporter substrate-binding protein [Rhodospirillaceae bacterium]
MHLAILRVVIAGILALMLLRLGAVADAATLRVGTTTMPPSQGNPYRNTGTPHIFTWSSIFDGLTRIDETGQLRPWLAVGWENLDPLTWRLTLRPGVTFSNGERLTSAAVVNAAAFFNSPAAAREVVARELGFIKSARIVDELTVDLITDVPTPHLPRALPVFYMVAPDHWTKLGPDEFARAPVGTGPFKIDRLDVAGWKMSAFAGSWRAPKTERLDWIVAPDASARVQAVLADRMDIALGLGPDEVAAIEANGGQGQHWLTANVWSIQFHQNQDSPLRDVRVREALNLAVDRDALVNGLLAGTTVAASQPGTRATFGFDPSIPPIPFDPHRAKQLLTEAGYPKGFSFVLQGVIGAGPADAAMFQKIAQDLAAIGVTMEIRPFPPNELIRAVVEGGWNGDAFGLTYASEPTIDVLRTMQNHSCLWSKPWYCDQRIMPAIRAALTEFDAAKGLSLRHDIMRFYRDEYAALFLYELPRFAGLRAGVSGFKEVHGFISFETIAVDGTGKSNR